MARKSQKCPPTVEPNQFGCVWSFGGMFDHHHHGRRHRKLLSDESHRSKSLPGARNRTNQVRMLTFDEQLRSINIESKKKEILNMETSFWKKIKSRYENKKNKNTNFINTIVVLKPSHRVLECPVDEDCRCSYFHPRINHTRVSFNDVRKKLKNAKKMKNTRDEFKTKKMTILPLSKDREPDVFVEARRHLAERLRLVKKGEGDFKTEKLMILPLERILLSSRVDEPMTILPLDMNNVLDVDSDPNMGHTGVDGCIEGSRVEYSSIVSSPKTDHKSENTDNYQIIENPSPVSVLDSFFTDNTSSPSSTIESELQIQPRLTSFMDDQRSISSYINNIYQNSRSNWVDFLSTDYPFKSSIEHKLIHDCVKEVLFNLHSQVTFITSKIRPFSFEKDVVNAVVDRVDWHNGQPVVVRTLDLIVRRDITNCRQWVDDVVDRNDVVFEIVDEILHELIMEAIFYICI